MELKKISSKLDSILGKFDCMTGDESIESFLEVYKSTVRELEDLAQEIEEAISKEENKEE